MHKIFHKPSKTKKSNWCSAIDHISVSRNSKQNVYVSQLTLILLRYVNVLITIGQFFLPTDLKWRTVSAFPAGHIYIQSLIWGRFLQFHLSGPNIFTRPDNLCFLPIYLCLYIKGSSWLHLVLKIYMHVLLQFAISWPY